jgi:hypothetical protein
MTKEQLETIRQNIINYRTSRQEKVVDNRIKWSEEACKKNWFVRFIYGLPNKPFTAELALDSLQQDGVFSVLIDCQIAGWKAIELCDAVESAQNLGLPLVLKPEDVSLLSSWLK